MIRTQCRFRRRRTLSHTTRRLRTRISTRSSGIATLTTPARTRGTVSWTSREDSTLEASAKKPIYNVFSQIDTDKSEEATAFVKNLVGSGAFSLFIPDGIQYSTFSKRTIVEAIRAEENDYAKGYSEKDAL